MQFQIQQMQLMKFNNEFVRYFHYWFFYDHILTLIIAYREPIAVHIQINFFYKRLQWAEKKVTNFKMIFLT